jgi:hypothetical protein
MIYHVWQELDYRIDICHGTQGGHIEHLQGRTETKTTVSPRTWVFYSQTALAKHLFSAFA